MKVWIKKGIIIFMMFGICATLLLPWSEVSGIQTLNGTSILTGNLWLSVLIMGVFFVSVLFLEKAKRIFFCSGLSSLSMLFSIMFSKYEEWGRLSNTCVGPYVGLLSVVCTIAVFVLFFRKALDLEI